MSPALLLLPLLLGLLGQPAAGRHLSGKYGECPWPGRTRGRPCVDYCSLDEDCPGSERCCSDGCGRRCVLPVGAKAGFCPRLEPGRVTICLVECSSDSDCAGRAKCCSMGCHVRCVEPVPAKPGTCPKRRVLQTFAPCTSTCTDDTDCPRSEKCCFTGCSRGCLAPNAGTRPERAALPLPPTLLPPPAPGAGPVPGASSPLLPQPFGPARGEE
ncbi:perlwapin-like isoform X2 [Struthio camelus]|uniref:perlwapin-like isoform X2 n=1 Tax=Struthio camelus TaxID=8801 RepID=UPI003603DF98